MPRSDKEFVTSWSQYDAIVDRKLIPQWERRVPNGIMSYHRIDAGTVCATFVPDKVVLKVAKPPKPPPPECACANLVKSHNVKGHLPWGIACPVCHPKM